MVDRFKVGDKVYVNDSIFENYKREFMRKGPFTIEAIAIDYEFPYSLIESDILLKEKEIIPAYIIESPLYQAIYGKEK